MRRHELSFPHTGGDWRILNFQRAPFGFPQPMAFINEGCTEANNDYADKSLGLWRIANLPSGEGLSTI